MKEPLLDKKNIEMDILSNEGDTVEKKNNFIPKRSNIKKNVKAEKAPDPHEQGFDHYHDSNAFSKFFFFWAYKILRVIKIQDLNVILF